MFLYTIIIYPIVQIIEAAFTFSQKAFKEVGISVLAISAVVSFLCLPLYAIADRRQEAERTLQKKLKPKIDKIKSVFKGDEQYMILSTYYRQNHYHPLYALRSSAGLLIQIPFFIAAYSYLSHLETLRGASFLFIRDLGAPDASIAPGGVNFLPLLMTAINCAAGAIYTRGFPLRDKIQVYGTSALFLLLLYNSPAGLVMYWTMNNVFSLLKNVYYSLPFKSKKRLLKVLASLCCASIIVYLLVIFDGNIQKRIFLSFVFVISALIPWTLKYIKKMLEVSRFDRYPEAALFGVFFLSAFALFFLEGLLIPSQLIVSSPQEFSFIDPYANPLFFIGNTAAQSFGVFIFWPVCLYLLFEREIKELFVFASLFVLTVSFCNIFMFPGDYGTIDITLNFARAVEHTKPALALNLFISLATAFGVSTATLRFLIKQIATVLLICSVSLFGVSAVNIVKIHRAFSELSAYYKPQEKITGGIEPIFHLSKTGKNVAVVMLDRAISAYIPYIFEESPELYEVYSGFVYYPNTVSFSGHTAYGAPPIFGGYESSPMRINERLNSTLKQKHNEALILLPRIFSDSGYSVTVTDPPYANYQVVPDLSIYDEIPNTSAYVTDSVYTDLWLDGHFSLPSTGEILKRNMLWYSFFRASPYAVREVIYMAGDFCSPITGDIRGVLNGYAVLDFLSALTDFSAGRENTVMFFVNNTTHDRTLLQAPDYVPARAVNNLGDSPFKNISFYTH
jgi:YidC/Oxa1 family membrane protein insertase